MCSTVDSLHSMRGIAVHGAGLHFQEGSSTLFSICDTVKARSERLQLATLTTGRKRAFASMRVNHARPRTGRQFSDLDACRSRTEV